MRLLIALVALTLTGCLSSAPIVPVTPANQQQVSSCQGIAGLHNGVVIGDFVISGGTAAVAGVSAAVAADQASTKTDLAIVAAVLGGLDMAGAAVAGFTSTEFANSQCSSVVGNLPISPGKP